jgi:tRNA/rRNA methyltransferase
VAPRAGWPTPTAGPASAGADQVLANARVFATVQEAVADCRYIYATTVRKRELWKPVVTPEAAARELRERGTAQAVLFGAERSGLETEEVAIAHAILTVPVNPGFKSLNLAQAVLLVAYEWFKAADVTPASVTDYDPPAEHAALEALYQHIDGALEAANYYKTPSQVASSKRNLRNLLTRPGYNESEIRTWRGIVHALVEGRRGGRPKT